MKVLELLKAPRFSLHSLPYKPFCMYINVWEKTPDTYNRINLDGKLYTLENSVTKIEQYNNDLNV